MQDLRLALRALWATPVVSVVAALSLALGIGANTAIFSLVNSLLLRTLPVESPDRLVTISTDSAVRLGFNAGIGWNYPMWQALQARAHTFDGAGAWKWDTLDLAWAGEKNTVQALVTSGDFFTTLGVRAAAGRALTVADDVRGGGPDGAVAVISHAFWQRRFQGSPTAIGTTLSIERIPFRIVGVMPRGFSGVEVGKSFDVALPLGAEFFYRGKRALTEEPRALLLAVMLRLGPGQSIDTATTVLRAMQPEMHGTLQLPKFATEPTTLISAGRGVDMPGSARSKYERPLVAIFVIVALVLLVACANIANLLLARAAARRLEVSVRLALGAPRWSLARQMLVESLVLAGIGAGGGLLMAVWAVRVLTAQLAVEIDTALDWRVLAFTAAIATLTALAFGLGAALRSMRVRPIDALSQRGYGFTSGRGQGVSGGLVVAQVALSLVLVTGAGWFVRSFTSLNGLSMGFDKDDVLLARVDVSRVQIDPAARVDFYHRLKDAVATVPGITQAAASDSTPLDYMGLPGEVTVPGAPAGAESERVVLSNRVTPGWFATYGTTIRAGRDFDARDHATGLPVVIVNEAFTRKFFPGRDPIGGTVSARTVVGVVDNQTLQGGFHADGKQRTIRDAAPPTMYVPLAQAAGAPARPTVAISIRSAGDPSRSTRGVSAAIASTDSNVAFTLRPLSEGLNNAMAQERIVAALSGFFGALAVLLAGLGLYGVTSYAVSRQRAEIGIRMALGAAPGSVVRLVLSRVAVLVGVGFAAGAGLTVWASTFVASLLYGLSPRDPITMVVAAAVLAAVGLFAGGLPALRAARIDPVTVLRES